MFRITKRFTGGNLEGIEISEVSAVKYEVGTVVSAPVAGSPYIVTSCVEELGGAHPHTQQYWVSDRGEHVSGPHPSVKAAKAAADAHGRAWGGAYQPWKKGWGEGEHVGGWANRYAVSRQRGRDAAPVVPNEAAQRQQAAFDAMTPEEHDAQADSHAWTAIGQGTMDPKFHHDRAAVHREAASTKRAKRDAMLAANPEFRPHVEARIKADKEVAVAKAARAGRQPGPPSSMR